MRLAGIVGIPLPTVGHYIDVTISAMASQITGISDVYSTVCSGAHQRKHQSSTSLAFERNPPVTGGFPSQRASNAENVSIWWRQHGLRGPSTFHQKDKWSQFFMKIVLSRVEKWQWPYSSLHFSYSKKVALCYLIRFPCKGHNPDSAIDPMNSHHIRY